MGLDPLVLEGGPRGDRHKAEVEHVHADQLLDLVLVSLELCGLRLWIHTRHVIEHGHSMDHIPDIMVNREVQYTL